MRNKVLGLVVVTMLMAVGICGCQKAPESSADGDILHAKDSVEDEVAAIVNESESKMEMICRKLTVSLVREIMQSEFRHRCRMCHKMSIIWY